MTFESIFMTVLCSYTVLLIGTILIIAIAQVHKKEEPDKHITAIILYVPIFIMALIWVILLIAQKACICPVDNLFL